MIPDTNANIENLVRGSVPDLWSFPATEALSNCFWAEHLTWLSDLGWKDALKTGNTVCDRRPTDHRTIDLLKRFVRSTRLINAHTGLTSSDIEDNVRRVQLTIATRTINTKLKILLGVLRGSWNNKGLQPGYTHWQPAFSVTSEKRVYSWTRPIEMILMENPQCSLWGKKFGGPVGSNEGILRFFSSLELDCHGELQDQQFFPWEKFLLLPPRNLHPIQSSDHIDEACIINWMALIAAQLHKVAADMRFLCARRVISVVKSDHYVGSSSIPAKQNPIELEKICSMCRSVLNSPREILDVLAHNGMERTLDTSWQSKTTYKRITILMDKIIALFSGLKYQFHDHAPDLAFEPEDLIIDKQISGMSRDEAFLEANQSTKNQSTKNQ